jgi:chromatin segregation and condensation protein Rec8/ScpA/Scc1 (kleisin family)
VRIDSHQLTLGSVFDGRSHSERIGLFLALLELVRQGRVRVRQDELEDPIEVSLIEERDPNAPSFG